MRVKAKKIGTTERERVRATRRKAFAAAIPFVRAATLKDGRNKDAPAHVRKQIGRMYIHPAEEDDRWYGNTAYHSGKEKEPHVYLLATDGMQLRAALIPGDLPGIPGDAAPYLEVSEDGIAPPDFGALLESCAEQQRKGLRRMALIDVAYLKAIHPQAHSVAVSFSSGAEPVELLSFLSDGTMIGYAIVMPRIAPDLKSGVEQKDVVYGTRPRIPSRVSMRVAQAQAEMAAADAAAAEAAESREDSPMEDSPMMETA